MKISVVTPTPRTIIKQEGLSVPQIYSMAGKIIYLTEIQFIPSLKLVF